MTYDITTLKRRITAAVSVLRQSGGRRGIYRDSRYRDCEQ